MTSYSSRLFCQLLFKVAVSPSAGKLRLLVRADRCRSSARGTLASLCLSGCIPGFDASTGFVGTLPKAVRLIARLRDVAMTSEAIQQRGSHLGAPEDARPFGKCQFDGDQHAGVRVELGQQMKQQDVARMAERQVTQSLLRMTSSIRVKLRAIQPAFPAIFPALGR